MRRGRPVKYDPEIVAEQLEDFVINHDYPLVKEFLLGRNDLPSFDYLLEMIKGNDNLHHAYKKAIDKQETYIERGALHGELNPTFAIFKLKQHQFGWKDKNEQAITVSNSFDVSQLSTEEIRAELEKQKRISDLALNTIDVTPHGED